MIERIDRLQIVVADRAAAAATYERILGAEVTREDESAYLGARRTVMALGESEIELLEPDGTGRAATALAERGEGLFAGGVATRDFEQLDARMRGLGLAPTREGEQAHLEGSPGFGARFVVSPLVARPRVGPVSFLYEVTITLIGDWRAAAAWYTAVFDLDPRRFSPIESRRFGYRGTLTLFDPPARLDRIELSQVTDSKSAMGRWVVRRGDSLYMAYVETHDLEALTRRLDGAGARWTPRGQSQEGERDGLWVHPSALHGLLLGVSRTTLAWEWSGRPELVTRAGS
ncbi:MAG TPA: VOC family protein [Thermoanaerobaculia bacterium]|jgi:catechol 2,3-dioxygenase-like lactoylglutathione lyase family enzyme|nr:VOC family protein [Thermoanaerobaculia bacterium]